jgi:hypothetical protein
LFTRVTNKKNPNNPAIINQKTSGVLNNNKLHQHLTLILELLHRKLSLSSLSRSKYTALNLHLAGPRSKKSTMAIQINA